MRKLDDRAKALLPINNLAYRTTRLRIDLRPHVQFRDRKASQNRVDQSCLGQGRPDAAALEVGVQDQLLAIVPLQEVGDTVLLEDRGRGHRVVVLRCSRREYLRCASSA